jgi:hypothetical protein
MFAISETTRTRLEFQQVKRIVEKNLIIFGSANVYLQEQSCRPMATNGGEEMRRGMVAGLIMEATCFDILPLIFAQIEPFSPSI